MAKRPRIDSLKELRLRLRVFAAERDWDQFHTAKNLAIALAVEAGELLEHFQWLVEGDIEKLSDKRRSAIEQEIADVLLYLVRLSDRLGIDLSSAAKKKMALNAKKYPVEKAKGNSKKYTDL